MPYFSDVPVKLDAIRHDLLCLDARVLVTRADLNLDCLVNLVDFAVFQISFR